MVSFVELFALLLQLLLQSLVQPELQPSVQLLLQVCPQERLQTSAQLLPQLLLQELSQDEEHSVLHKEHPELELEPSQLPAHVPLQLDGSGFLVHDDKNAVDANNGKPSMGRTLIDASLKNSLLFFSSFFIFVLLSVIST